MQQVRWTFMALIFSVMFLAACTSDGDVDSETSDSGEGDTQTENGGDLVIAEMTDIVSLDPHGSNDIPSNNVRTNIYDKLTTLDENMELQPSLATDWEAVDETTWRFSLKEDVTFHDGSEFNADVVKLNFDRVRDPAIASPKLFLYEMITDVTVVDEYTVELTTEYPFAPLLSHLVHDGGGMISGDVINEDYENAIQQSGLDLTLEDYYSLREEGGAEFEEAASEIGEFTGVIVTEKPVGTGPFKLQEWSSGQQTVIERNDEYHGEPARLDTVTFKVVPETAARLAELETGTSHVAANVSTSNVDRVSSHDETYLDETPSFSLAFVGFNTDKEPLNDPLVRQAISHAVNKESIIDGVYNGIGSPADGPLASGVFGYDEDLEGLPYDMDRAKELMVEAGQEDGFTINIMTNDNPERVDTAILIQEALAELNIDVTIEQVEWGAYLEATDNGEHDMYILSWTTVTADADYGLFGLFHSSMHGAPGNRMFFSDDNIDNLLEQARQEIDEDARFEIYSEVQEELVDLAPMIYTHHTDFLTGVRNNVDNFVMDELGIYRLHETSINE